MKWWHWALLAGVWLMLDRRNIVWGHVAGRAVRLELASIGGGHYLRVDAAAAFNKMAAAAEADGVPLEKNSSFRTFEEQQQLKLEQLDGKRTDPVAEPGYSNHEGGVAVDISTKRGTNAQYVWLRANAHRFGFRQTISSEPWHWEYRP